MTDVLEQGFDDFLAEIEPKHHNRFRAITAVTDRVCAEHLEPLEQEYRVFAWMLAAGLLMPTETGLPALADDRAKPQSWAAGVLYALAVANFLSDPGYDPVMTAEELAAAVGVSQSTMSTKANRIRERLGFGDLDPQLTLPSNADLNPMIWMFEMPNGLVIDIREAPLDVQRAAADQGLIPFVPADMEPDPDDADPTDADEAGEAADDAPDFGDRNDGVIARIGFDD